MSGRNHPPANLETDRRVTKQGRPRMGSTWETENGKVRVVVVGAFASYRDRPERECAVWLEWVDDGARDGPFAWPSVAGVLW